MAKPEVTIGYDDLMRQLKDAKFRPRPFIFADHVESNGGCLPDTLGAHACWYYAKSAHKMLDKVTDGAEYEGERDHVLLLNNMARSIAAFYSLESPSVMLRHIVDVRLEALRCKLPWNPLIEDPFKEQFRRRTN